MFTKAIYDYRDFFCLLLNFQYLFNKIQLYYKNKLKLLKWVV